MAGPDLTYTPGPDLTYTPDTNATESPKKPRSAIAEIANQGYAGVVADLPEMVGKAAQYATNPGDAIYGWGKGVADAAKARGAQPDLQPDPENHNIVTNTLASGARMIPQSLAPAAAVGGVLAAAPVSVPGALLIGSALGSLPAAMSQGQTTLDKAEEAGVGRDVAIPAARKTALIEGAGETLGTFAGAKLLGLGGKALSTTLARATGKAEGSAAGHVLADATDASVLKPWLKQIPETLATEVGTEMGQNAGEAYIEQQAGIDKQTPWDAAKEAVGPTIGMTALLAPFGLAGFGIRAKQNARRAETLTSADAEPGERLKAAFEIKTQLDEINPEAGKNFGEHVLRAIENKTPLEIGEHLFAPPVVTAPTQPLLGYNSVIIPEVPRSDGQGAAPIDPTVGPLSAAAADAIKSGLTPTNANRVGTLLRNYATRQDAQDALDQREDGARMDIIPHPRGKSGFAVVPKDQSALAKMDLEEAKRKATTPTPAQDEDGGLALAGEDAQAELQMPQAQPVAEMPARTKMGARMTEAARLAAVQRNAAVQDEESAQNIAQPPGVTSVPKADQAQQTKPSPQAEADSARVAQGTPTPTFNAQPTTLGSRTNAVAGPGYTARDLASIQNPQAPAAGTQAQAAPDQTTEAMAGDAAATDELPGAGSTAVQADGVKADIEEQIADLEYQANKFFKNGTEYLGRDFEPEYSALKNKLEGGMPQEEYAKELTVLMDEHAKAREAYFAPNAKVNAEHAAMLAGLKFDPVSTQEEAFNRNRDQAVFDLPDDKLKQLGAILGVKQSKNQSRIAFVERITERPGSDVRSAYLTVAQPTQPVTGEGAGVAKDTAEAKIRATFNAEPRTVGKWHPITIEHNGVTQSFLANQVRVVSDGKRDGTIHLINVRKGRMIKGDPLEDLAYSYKLDGKNNLVEEGLPKKATDEQKAMLSGVAKPKDPRTIKLSQRTESTNAQAPKAIEASPPAQTSQAEVERTATEHAGVKIYPITFKGEPHWSVQSEDNRTNGKVLGDTIHATLEGAKQSAEEQVRRVKSKQERNAAYEAEQAAAQAKKDANKGKSLADRKRDFDLDKPTKLPVQAGLGTGTRRESMQKAVDQDRHIASVMVEDTAAKKKDKATLELVRARGYILGASNENIPLVKQGLEAQARLKANKYEKPEYRVYDGRDSNGSFREISKTEYDYAQSLKEKPTPALANTAQPAIESVAEAGPVGRNNVPLSEGGKPYKTNRAAKEAKKLQPMMRVITVDGGWALGPKTAAQIKAQEKAAARLARGTVGNAGVPMSAHELIASEGGLNKVHRNDLGVEGNPRIGSKFLYAGTGGISIERATERLKEEGYLPPEANHTQAFDLIRKSLKTPQYTPDGFEAMARAQEAVSYEDHLAQQQEAAQNEEFDDPFEPMLDGDFVADDFDVPGHDEASDPIKLEVNALLALADDAGINEDAREAIKEDAHYATLDQSEQAFYEAYRNALKDAIAASNRVGSADSGEAGNAQGSQEGLTAVDQHNKNSVNSDDFISVLNGESVGGNAGAGKAGVNVSFDDSGRIASIGNTQDLPAEIRARINSGELHEATFTVAVPDNKIVAVQFRGQSVPGDAKDQINKLVGVAYNPPTALTLTAPSRQEVLAQQAAIDAEAKRKEEGGDKPIPRKQLTGDIPDLFNPQGSVFDVPEEPTPAAEATAILDAANVTGKERIDALKDVKKGDITPDELKAAYPAKEDKFPSTAQGAIDAFNADDSAQAVAIMAKLKLDDLKEVGGAIGFRPQNGENAKSFRERIGTVADKLTLTNRKQTSNEMKLHTRLTQLASDYDRAIAHRDRAIANGAEAGSSAFEGQYEGQWTTIDKGLEILENALREEAKSPDYAKVSAMVKEARPAIFDAAKPDNSVKPEAKEGSDKPASFSRGPWRSKPTGLTPTQFTAELTKAFGAKVAERLQAKGVVVPLADQSKLPAHVVPFLRDGDIIYGFYDPKTDRTYAVLENLTPEMVKGLVLHEVGVHFGFKSMLGEAKYNSVMNRLDFMRRAGNKAVKEAYAEAQKNSVRDSQVPEETLAYLVQTQPEMGIVKEIIARIKAFLFSEFGIGGKYLTEADLTMLARAAVDHSSRMEDGGSVVPAFARVWHGSPHRFLQFDASKIGTGEGAQAYGHGLYLAESREVAEQYRKQLSSKYPVSHSGVIEENGKYLAWVKPSDGRDVQVIHTDATEKGAKNALKKYMADKRGALYQVDLPDDQIAKMLDWDKPLSQQAPEVQAMFTDAQRIKYADETGKEIYRLFSGGRGNNNGDQKTGAENLSALGIPGIRYLDGGSRGAGSGSSNYVIFPGMEHILTILDVNGVPVAGAKKDAVIAEQTTPDSGGAFSRNVDQTGAEAFKRWFGDSKVVDSTGKPLVVYHGTPNNFNVFLGRHRNSAQFSAEIGATWFTPDEAMARGYSGGKEPMAVYLSMQNPYIHDADGGFWMFENDRAIKAARAGGHDGVIIKNVSDTSAGQSDRLITTYVTFSPTQIKSAIGNNGDFDGENPDIRFSRSQIIGQTNRQHTPEQLRAMKNVGFQIEVPTLKERAQALYKDAGKKLTQGIVDQFAPVKDLDKNAYGLLRLAKGASGAFESFLKGGKLKITDGVYDFDDANKGGVVDKLLIPLGGEHHDFMRWVAANRAERLQGEGRENLFSPQDIADLKTLANGTTDFDYTIQTGPTAGRVTRDRTLIYADANRVFNEFNKNILDMAEQSGLIDGASRKVWEHEFYVPFYRVADEDGGGVRGMSVKGSVLRQQAFKELKGGKNALNADLLDNTLMNWAHLLDAAAKNRAAKATIEAAERMGVATGGNQSILASMGASVNNKNGVVWFMDGGIKRYSLIDNQGDGPFIMTAINALEYAGMRNPVMNAMGTMKHVLTVGVTASPFFKIRNLIRDSVQVIGTSGINPNPAVNIGQGWKLTNPKSDAYFRLLAGGGTIHFGTMLEGSEAKRVQALVESGVKDSTILNSEHKVKAFYRKFIEPGITAYNELGNRGEAINRASLYDQLRKQGVNHADASLQARDLMDFSMQGSFTSIRFLTQVVPFLNARLQGLYKLGRAAKEDPARFSMVLGTVAAISLGLLAAYSDDDDWKKREEWDRNNFWWFKVGGTAFRIPKPFEIGAIATLAERGFERAFDKEMTNKRFMNQVTTLLGDNLSMNPVPQLVKPMLDVYSNKDSFSGRPIETMSMERLKSEYRFTDRTSMTARAASTSMNAVTGLVGKEALSPVQIDHMLRGYFGWLGAFIVGSADKLARPLTDQKDQASPDYWKVATGGMVSELSDAPSRYVSAMYEQAKTLEEAYGTYRMLVKEGRIEEAKDFMTEHKDELSNYKRVENVKKAEAKFNERIRMIERSAMDSDAKRDAIRKIKEQKDRVARQLAPI